MGMIEIENKRGVWSEPMSSPGVIDDKFGSKFLEMKILSGLVPSDGPDRYALVCGLVTGVGM